MRDQTVRGQGRHRQGKEYDQTDCEGERRQVQPDHTAPLGLLIGDVHPHEERLHRAIGAPQRQQHTERQSQRQAAMIGLEPDASSRHRRTSPWTMATPRPVSGVAQECRRRWPRDHTARRTRPGPGKIASNTLKVTPPAMTVMWSELNSENVRRRMSRQPRAGISPGLRAPRPAADLAGFRAERQSPPAATDLRRSST